MSIVNALAWLLLWVVTIAPPEPHYWSATFALVMSAANVIAHAARELRGK